MKSDFTMIADEINLTKYFDLTSEPAGRFDISYQNTLADQYYGGSKIINQRVAAKNINIEFYSSNKNLADIKQVLSTLPSVFKLQFSDYPDYYWVASFNDDLNIYRSADNIFEYYGNFSLLIPDGCYHSVATKTFPATLNSDGILEATITNDGTADVPISYEITHNADNGYIGIVSAEGAMEFGKRDEVDGNDYQENDVLKVSSRFGDWPRDTGQNAQNPNIGTNGTLSEKEFSDSQFGKNGLYLSDAGTGNFWHGGMKSVVLPNDSQSGRGADKIRVYFNHVFVAGLQSQTGMFMLNLLDEEDNLVCSYFVTKSGPNSGTATAQFLIGGSKPYVWKAFDFVPFPDAARNQFSADAGHCSIEKMGDKFTCYWRNQAIGETACLELKNVKVVKAQYFIGQYGDRGLSESEYMSMNYLRNISFTKINVDKWSDVPNRYSNGDIFTIDGDTKKPYINGMLALNDEIVGTNYFKAPPGSSKVQFYFSDFSGPLPNVTAEIREAWL